MNKHVRCLLDLPILTKEKVIQLREIHHNMENNIRTLKCMQQPVDIWRNFLIVSIINKLDNYTINEYKLKLNKTDILKLNCYRLFSKQM